MYQQALPVRGVLLLEFRNLFAPAIHIAIDEVVNHLDLVPDIELAQGALSQILRNGGYSVALLNGEAGDR